MPERGRGRFLGLQILLQNWEEECKKQQWQKTGRERASALAVSAASHTPPLPLAAAAAQGCQALAHAPLAARPATVLPLPLSVQTTIFSATSVVLYFTKLAHQQQINESFEIIFSLHILPGTYPYRCRFSELLAP